MNRTINGIGSTGGAHGAGPSLLNHPSPSTSASAQIVSEEAQSHRRSLKNRLLACLGMTAPPGESPGTASAAARNIPRPMRRSNRDTEVLAESIRTKYLELHPSAAKGFERQLASALDRKDARGRLSLLSMLEKNVINAVRGTSSRPAHASAPLDTAPATDRAPPPRQKTKLVVVRFKGAEARLTEEQDQQIQAIRLSILKLPSAKATDYQWLLRDVISADDPVRRGRLLRQMCKQIAEHLAP